jgi:hypothetical protein
MMSESKLLNPKFSNDSKIEVIGIKPDSSES